MTEDEYLQALPALADWDRSMRARFVEGMAQLQATPIAVSDLDVSIGVVAMSEDECCAYYITREKALARGVASNWEQYQLEAIRTPPTPGSLKVLVAANFPGHTGFTLIEVQIYTRLIVQGPGSSKEN